VTAALASAAASRHGLIFVDLAEKETFLGWTEIYRRSLGLAATLQALGIEPGDRVALVLPTAPSFVTAFFGVLLAGMGASAGCSVRPWRGPGLRWVVGP
jgi:acyl-CoA synthetase (AMP-forming)/AMP-acid ligase II